MTIPPDHSCLSSVHKDGLGLSQAHPTAIGPLQLLSIEWYKLRSIIGILSSSRSVVQAPCLEYKVRGQVCPIHILQHLSYVYTLAKRWFTSPVIKLLVMADNIIYGTYLLLETLTTMSLVGRYQHLSRRANEPPPVRRNSIVHVSHW